MQGARAQSRNCLALDELTPSPQVFHKWPCIAALMVAVAVLIAPSAFADATPTTTGFTLSSSELIFHRRSLRSGVEQVCKLGSQSVPKIVPSGGLFPFGSRLARTWQTRMNTGESKLRQIWLKC